MDSSGAVQPEKENLSSSLIPHSSTNQQQQQQQQQQHQQQLILEKLSRPMAFDKMEALVKEMQDVDCGVPVRSQKLFLTSIPAAFMGYDLIEWLMERLSIEESEALNIANQLCLHGYFFPVNDCKILVVKDDSSLYRFQTPYYWPWQHKTPDNIEYAIYLVKRSLRNKQRHGLEEYETDALSSLHKNLKGKWDFITMQAEEQIRVSKERKKGDKIVTDSQERAFWRVHRPPPNQFTPLEPCPVPSRDRQGKPRKRTDEDCQREVDYLKKSLGRIRMKMSQVCDSLSNYGETFAEYDYFLQPALPSNPWVTEDLSFWQLNSSFVEVPTEKRVKRWSISIEELVSDPTGLHEFTLYLKKEYSHENIRFWIAVNELRRSAQSQICHKVDDIYEEFLKPGAPCEINIDSKTMEHVQQGLGSPSRFTFDSASEHIYALLLKKDCYPRFIRSEHYRSLLASGIQPSHKKRFFGFGGAIKKKSTTAPPTNAGVQVLSSATAQSNLSRRRGSDRSLSGSAHELAISGIKNVSDIVPHSHSQNNLCDIPCQPFREVPKSTTMNVELVGPDTSSVYPWGSTDYVEASKVSVSICPWEDELPSTSTQEKRRSSQSTCAETRSSSSDISEISERLRKSCGVRQNTLDPDMFSSQRLAPTNYQQRRASITTISPRTSSEMKQAEENVSCQISVINVSHDEIQRQNLTTSDIVIHASASEAEDNTPETYHESQDMTDEDGKDPSPESESCSTHEKSNTCDDSSTISPNMPVIKIIQAIGEAGSSEDSANELKSAEMFITCEDEQENVLDSGTKNDIQECEQVDHNIFKENVGNNIVPGCVAPAPTPIPAMAPLAEDEVYTVDEDKCSIKEEMDTVIETAECAVQSPSQMETSELNAKPEEAKCNTVCPWEDEDGRTSTDGSYVKTYSTLGYL